MVICSVVNAADFTPQYFISLLPKYRISTSFGGFPGSPYERCQISMAGTPQAIKSSYFYVTFQVGHYSMPTDDFGSKVFAAEFTGMINNGYRVSFKVTDAFLMTLNTLIENAYFEIAKTEPLYINFQFKDTSGKVSVPDTATPLRTAIVTNMEFLQGPFEKGQAEITAVDPVTYFLSTSFGDGGVLVGRLDQALTKLFNNELRFVDTRVAKFRGSDTMRWYLLRMDYKTFLMNILEYGAGLTYDQTGILIQTDGSNLNITTQGQTPSRQRRFYSWGQGAANTVLTGQITSNNSQFVTAGAISSAGTPSTYKAYFSSDNESKLNGTQVFKYCVVDETYTAAKQVPKLSAGTSFLGPDQAALADAVVNPKSQNALGIGMTNLKAMPEMYSGAEVGVPYQDYLDGKARAFYFGLLNNELKGVITVPGDGEFADTMGLGVDTVYIRWALPNVGNQGPYWGNGNWCVYGFRHTFKISKGWLTDIYVSRWDTNATGKQVPS